LGRGLKYDIPGEDWRRSVDDLAVRGWDALFAPELTPSLSRGQRVVEIGFGRGEFLLELAGKSPETSFLGIEVSFKRVLKMARRLARTGLRNVRLVEGRGQVAVEQACERGSVDAFWINFSDPWPKDRHADRRLLRAPFVAAAARALAPGGRLHVATDDTPYAGQIEAVLSAEPELENVLTPDPWRGEAEGRIRTGYEEGWRAEGRPLYFFEYRRRPAER
jgi:tRNA (guanine-N7-)-methyltransferase